MNRSERKARIEENESAARQARVAVAGVDQGIDDQYNRGRADAYRDVAETHQRIADSMRGED